VGQGRPWGEPQCNGSLRITVSVQKKRDGGWCQGRRGLRGAEDMVVCLGKAATVTNTLAPPGGSKGGQPARLPARRRLAGRERRCSAGTAAGETR